MGTNLVKGLRVVQLTKKTLHALAYPFDEIWLVLHRVFLDPP
jgi:hypothetical protein